MVSVNSHINKVWQNPLLHDSGGGVGLNEDSLALFGGRKEGWEVELHRIPIGLEDWGSMSLPDTAAFPTQEPPFFQLIAGDVDFDATLNLKQLLEFNGNLAFPQDQFHQKPELNQKVVDVSEGMPHTRNQIHSLLLGSPFIELHSILRRLCDCFSFQTIQSPHHQGVLSPLDEVCKMGAYKVFSEASPVLQFVNFTRNQAILESTSDASCIHIIDFDIGFGAQRASFLQEFPMRNSRGSPSLKITAFSSPSSYHPIELNLMRDNLIQFANDIGIDFQLEVVNFDSFDPTLLQMPIFRPSGAEATVVNFPTWNGLPFSLHIHHALQAYETLLDSLDAANISPDVANKMERFLLQPRIECAISRRLDSLAQLPPWKTLSSLAGFSPLMFSNFSESRAELIPKRTPMRAMVNRIGPSKAHKTLIQFLALFGLRLRLAPQIFHGAS
ncbi:Transcription factor GRAS [Dillenia turbinata]|uniref:Transcription factor GRAS n=1 Tax=Dillenia turbinata TaxID=194707 RepID=A0AAN8YZJ1_9MAGN